VRCLIHRIVVLIDSSPQSEQALIEAINVGRIFHSIIACVHPMHGHDGLSLKVSGELKARAGEIVKSTGLEFEWSEGGGIPAQVIVKAAISLEADLVVVGSLGEEGLARHLVGSAVERIVKKSPCSVLVVKKGKTVF
jgi:nucleotide-binding universal stress UspA family protein